MKRAFLLAILPCLLLSCGQQTETGNSQINTGTSQGDSEISKWEAQANRITIIRDDFGVPHVYGKTDADAVFGLLYAQCEDDFNRVEQNYIWAIGRLAEVEGEEALYSDLRARLFMSQEEAIAAYESSPPWLQELCRAFADGINYYLHTHPEVTPRLLTRFEPWMPMYFSEGSIGGDIERVSTRRLEALYANDSLPLPFLKPKSAMQEAASIPGNSEHTESLFAANSSKPIPGLEAYSANGRLLPVEPAGSNGIAISGELTESGNTLLLINPHTSFYFRGEVHMVSEEGLNAYGAVTWGQFFIYQGFNEKTGWMHTSTYTDVIDEFEEDITWIEEQPMYAFGEEFRPVESSEVTLSYKDGDGIKQKTFPLYHTHHGPITHSSNGRPVATAMMWEPATALEQSYTRTKQEGYSGFRKMMDLRTNSSNNTVYADAEGNIAYFHGNFIPKRDPQFNYRKPVDGSDPATDWQGLHTVDESIHLLNPGNGWLQNCNSTPYTAALEYSPKAEDYPEYMTMNRENYRGVHAVELLTDRSGYTLDNLISLAYDPYLPAFEILIPGILEAYDLYKASNGLDLLQTRIDRRAAEQGETESARAKIALDSPEFEAAIEALRAWDFRTGEESAAMTLAHFYGDRYDRQAQKPAQMSREEWRQMSGMAFTQYLGTDSPLTERLEVFQDVLEQLEADFGATLIPWGEVNRYQRLDGSIRQAFNDSLPSMPIGFASGRWGALAAYGARYHNNTKRIYGTRGNSFVAVVEFGDKVRAKSILAGGQSGDPESPHFDDQAQDYADVNFKEVPFYKEDVEAREQERYHPGQRGGD
ncbi:Acyl-homoserine lactone (AHL) acylase PvdQ [Robiginitalea myxolifaciens]|uniref:Acyl-homoserine lactone (AHL) acylase PvdQ n=1 Tax=Robiginitalea myxolifaciens TaxID=400055 RepID=A0A1I6G969_9FLAO|nr:penicillin acylase family protein [Robiginitalea myxolifaciens]SFR38728.1 Acyl-homoserine lactone (AHL) acylase PvdQ [Robiginitalea myxolifaciens]